MNKDILNIVANYISHDTITRLLHIFGYDSYIYNLRLRRLSGYIRLNNTPVIFSDAYSIKSSITNPIVYHIYKYDSAIAIIYNPQCYRINNFINTYLYTTNGTNIFRVPIFKNMHIYHGLYYVMRYIYMIMIG